MEEGKLWGLLNSGRLGSSAGGAAILAGGGFWLATQAAGSWVGGPVLIPVSVFALWLVLLLGTAVILGKRARAAETAEARLREILEASPDTILLVDGRGCIVSANPQAEPLFGYPRQELLGRPLAVLLPQNDFRFSIFDCRLKEVPSESSFNLQSKIENRKSQEFTGRRKDGSKLSLLINSRFSPAGCASSDGPLTTLVIRDITQNRRTEDALRAREAHLRLVVEQMPAILWTTDTELHVTSSVGAGLAAVNLDPQEVIGMTMLECLGKEDLESTPIAAHLNALRGRSLSYEMEWKGRSFQVRVEPLRDSEKRIVGTIGVVLDVTDHKQTVAELRARVQQQQAVAALGQQALAGADLDTLMGEAAAAITETLHVEFCQILEPFPDGKSLRVRAGAGWHAEHSRYDSIPAGANSQAGYTLQAGEPVTVDDLRTEKRFRGSALLRDHAVVSGMSVLIQGKQRTFGVLGAHTAQKRAFTRDDLHFLQAVANVLASAVEREQAEEEAGRLIAILEATPDLVAMAGTDRRLLYLNRAGRALLGIGTERDISRGTLDDLHPPERRSVFLNEGVPAALDKGVWSGESTVLTRAGKQVPVSQVVLAHRSPSGSVEFLSTIARDVSERQRLEEQLRQAQKMEAVGRLAGGIAHDFNNLLTVINGYAEFLIGHLPAGSPPHGFAHEVKKAGERAAALTRQLLAFSRKQILTPRVLNLNALITDMGKLLRRLIGEDIELVTALEPALLPVQADLGQMEQVLMNLAVNARDAMPRGGKLTLSTGNVELDAAYAEERPEVCAGHYVLLAVGDTGCGMSKEVQAHLFEPFFTTKEVGKGTGLGLATVFGIVKQSGGHIEVDSEPGRGTTFKIYLPRIEQPAPTAGRDAIAPAMPGGTETVLLVEDEEGVRSLAGRILRQGGYTVLEASQGEEALALCEQHPGPIHLLLTDIVMPRLSGTALARRLALLRPGIKILFISGFNESALLRHGAVSREIDWLLKPFTPEALAQEVRAVLDRPGSPGERSDLSAKGGQRRWLSPKVPEGSHS